MSAAIRAFCRTLVDLLPTRQAFVARDIAAPEPLLNAIDRVTPMLRMFRHGDGALAGFNGMGVSEPETPGDACSRMATAGAAAILDAPYSGYQRLEAQRRDRDRRCWRAAAAGVFEGSACGLSGVRIFQRAAWLVVNCGAPRPDAGEAREAARATAAHSTLVIDDHSSCRFAPVGSEVDGVRRGAGRPFARRGQARLEEAGGQTIEARHDGYARRYGAIHRRVLRLRRRRRRAAGRRLDRVGAQIGGAPRENAGGAVSSPSHGARAIGAGPGSVVLTLPSGEEWRFEFAGRAVTLEESIFFAAPGGARPTTQIVACRPACATMRRCAGPSAGAAPADHSSAPDRDTPGEFGFPEKRDIAPQQNSRRRVGGLRAGVCMAGDLARIGRALISVSDKSGLVELGAALAARGIELVSTGGTARALARGGPRRSGTRRN